MQNFGTPQVIVLLVGLIIEVFIALYVLKKDSSYIPNITLALAYLSLAMTLFTNLIYIFKVQF